MIVVQWWQLLYGIFRADQVKVGNVSEQLASISAVTALCTKPIVIELLSNVSCHVTETGCDLASLSKARPFWVPVNFWPKLWSVLLSDKRPSKRTSTLRQTLWLWWLQTAEIIFGSKNSFADFIPSDFPNKNIVDRWRNFVMSTMEVIFENGCMDTAPKVCWIPPMPWQARSAGDFFPFEQIVELCQALELALFMCKNKIDSYEIFVFKCHSCYFVAFLP